MQAGGLRLAVCPGEEVRGGGVLFPHHFLQLLPLATVSCHGCLWAEVAGEGGGEDEGGAHHGVPNLAQIWGAENGRAIDGPAGLTRT